MTRSRLPVFDEAVPSRRRFLEMAAAAITIAGAGACHRERTTLLPYSSSSSPVVPGNFLTYATTLVQDGWALGVLVSTREGRPLKVEGNPDHPASLGATGPAEQACLMDLYNPSRSRTVLHDQTPVGLRSFLAWMSDRADALAKKGGQGLRFLLEPSSSPYLESLRRRISERLPNARFYSYSPIARDNLYAGTHQAFGTAVETLYDLSKAKVVVGLDADLLSGAPGRLAYARALAGRRDPSGPWMSRIYAIEAELSLFGMLADHRLPVRSVDIEASAWALLGRVAERMLRSAPSGLGSGPTKSELEALVRHARTVPPSVPTAWFDALAADLLAAPGQSLIVAGVRQPPSVHAASCALNALLGNQGTTVAYIDSPLLDPLCGPGPIGALADEIDRGLVDTLVINAFDPVYTAPADLGFRDKLARVPGTIYLGMYRDSTARSVHWHVPATHDAESWGDARAFDGTVSIQQRLIEPLFGGATLTEILAAFVGEAGRDSLDMFRDFWRARTGASRFERFWEEVLRRGTVDGTTSTPADVQVRWPELARAPSVTSRDTGGGIELNLLPDLTVHDGRYSENGWLLELPDPVTRLSWQNAALVAPALAARHGLAAGDLVDLRLGDRTQRAPIVIVPTLADEAVCLTLGWGRLSASGSPGVGVNAYTMRTTSSPWFETGVNIEKTGKHENMVDIQGGWSQEGRHLALATTLEELQNDPDMFEVERGALDSLYPAHSYSGLKWAMAIDLAKCIGCAACVAACNAENNIPVVGRDQCAMGREMQWLRIDRYFENGPRGTEAITMPLACVHCENAPCEYVCPVNATVHSSEGINQMVYNRCVGTRFCSNNCPYKVRRFNFLEYQRHPLDPVEQMRMNPEVSVRSRGVMEKCTYCIQRIERARISAQIAGASLRGDDVTTACQQACPTSAIAFGSLNDRESRVAKMHEDARSYVLLHELGTRPRTAHLVRIKNPNPEIG